MFEYAVTQYARSLPLGISWICYFLAFCWLLGGIPSVVAVPTQDPFPNLSFGIFSGFIQQNFGQDISLSTVLTILFTLIDNPDILNLHSRQQNPQLLGEKRESLSGWIKVLTRALRDRLDDTQDSPFASAEGAYPGFTNDAMAHKLIALSKLLGLNPYDSNGRLCGKLKEVSKKEISPALLLCSESMECQTAACHGRAIHLRSRDRDISKVTLIKGSTFYEKAMVVIGECKSCNTLYHADHEHGVGKTHDGRPIATGNTYLNSAKYLKIGQQIWADRVFSSAILNGVYSFHASTAAFVQFWNDSFWRNQTVNCNKVSRRQVWQAFVQESIRRVAAVSGESLEYPDRVSIDNLTGLAFAYLGQGGLIEGARNHSCTECTQPFKEVADHITGDDPAAVLGIDENRAVPLPNNPDDVVRAQEDAAQARAQAEVALMRDDDDVVMDVDNEDVVKMVVLDGIVMGPQHCAYENCTEGLANARNGVFCLLHEDERGHLCRVKNCNNPKQIRTQACAQHQGNWHSHIVRHGRQSLLGIRRMLRRTEEERLEWLPRRQETISLIMKMHLLALRETTTL